MILLAAVGVLIKMFLNHNLTKDADKFRADLQSRADEFRVQLQSNASVEIEKLRATLQQTLTEHQIRFSKLHEKRADFIKDLYQRLIRARTDAAMYVFGDTHNQSLAVETSEKMLELYRFIADNKIFLPDRVCELVDEFESKLRRSVLNVEVYWARTSEYAVISAENQQMRNKVIMEAAEFIESKSDEMLKELVKEFRVLLGDAPQTLSSTAPKTDPFEKWIKSQHAIEPKN